MSQSYADNILSLYERHAQTWAKRRSNGFLEKAWLDVFIETLPDKESDRSVLDIGCGTGKPVALYLMEKGCSLTGVDGAAAMIAIASRAYSTHRWIKADMRDMPLLDPFDGVIAWHSFFHLTPEDQRLMFEIFGRLCKPLAPLMFTSGTSLGEAIGEFEGEPLYHGSLDPQEYRSLLDENGFEVLKHVEEDPNCGQSTIWLARKRA
ncbi:MAG: class I SAM-dependent methyltransferase [Hyphomicrobiales bacterium]